MKFIAFVEYTTDGDLIARVRPSHRQYLTSLMDSGKLAAAGPFLDDSGALFIYEAETEQDALAILKKDPFAMEGVFMQFEIRPWKSLFYSPKLFALS